MTIEELQDMIDYLKGLAENDDESAHITEDRIHRQVLCAIANGTENAKELAALALTTKDIPFERWFA